MTEGLSMNEQEKTLSRLIDCLVSIDNHLAQIEDRLVDQNGAIYDAIMDARENYDDYRDALIKHWAGRRVW